MLQRWWRAVAAGLVALTGLGGEAGAQGTIPRSSAYANSWALVIGINDYDRVQQLNYAVADAKAIQEILPSLGFPREKTQVLLDREATKTRIEWSLSRDFSKMGSEDRLLIYFAGHGETNPLKQGQEGYILPVDADPRALPATAIAMADLRKIGQRLEGKHFLFIMDACFSGFALNRSGPEKVDPVVETALTKPAVQVLTAGRQGDQAVEHGGHGLFTHRLLEALGGAADTDNQGFVTAAQLFAWIQPRVTRDSRGKMNPQFSTLDGEGQFVIFLPKRAASLDRPSVGAAPAERAPDPALEAERRRLEQERKRLAEERAVLEQQRQVDEERRAVEEQRRRLEEARKQEPPRVASIPPAPPEKLPVQLTTSGHGLSGSFQGLLSAGLFTAEYAIEIDGALAVEWRTLDVESNLSLAPGPHKIRILRRYFLVRSPTPLYDGVLQIEDRTNRVAIDFAQGLVTVNGKTDKFIPEKR